MSVCVFFGSSKIDENDEHYSLTMELSGRVAELGYDIASGGYSGVMEAALRGAVNYDVKRIGITCDLFKDRLPNDFLSDEIKTKDYFERLEILIDIGDFFIAMAGESGTLFEVSAVVALLERKFIENRYLLMVGSEWRHLNGFLHFDENKKNIMIADDLIQATEIIRTIQLN
jgi:uncharacterized protein (TIGR00725 family)